MTTQPITFRWAIRPQVSRWGTRVYQPVCIWSDGKTSMPGRPHSTEAWARHYIRTQFDGGRKAPGRFMEFTEGWSEATAGAWRAVGA